MGPRRAWSIVTGLLHALPLKVSALPLKSTAAQKDVDGQDTESRPFPNRPCLAIAVGRVHALPLYLTSSPLLSTATQYEADTQDTESRKEEPP
jgi:hypothetical protein